MKREDEIKQAAENCVTSVCKDCFVIRLYHECNKKCIGYYEQANGFTKGAKWADEHPKSPWISVDDDLPCNHEELIDKEKNMTKRVLVIGKDGKANVTSNMMSMFFIENCWQWACEIYFKVTHWMFIPNLPEE